jgi:hypothetical protein
MVWGLNKEDELILVKDTDVENKLVFDSLRPTYDLSYLKVMLMAPISHPCKGAVLSDYSKNWDHGLE